MKYSKFSKKLKFIDLFSGIGGFHQAISYFNAECIMASEIDPYAIATYDKNYNIKNKTHPSSAIDITKLNEKDIPDFDILTAGFPCQAFSKAGKRLGFKDTTKGTLFFEVIRIISEKKPKYILLENVRNLASHDDGKTWNIIKNSLIELGYVVPNTPLIMSPHNLGIPQLRERVFIPGYYSPKNAGKQWIDMRIPSSGKNSVQANKIIMKNNTDKSLKLDEYEIKILNAWDLFYKNINLDIIGFPVWSEELNNKIIPKGLPSWKTQIIIKNRKLFVENQTFIREWIKKTGINTVAFSPTHRKFEWQAGKSIKGVYEGIIQFRPSGIRVKRPTSFPTLVAMVQTPIIGWEKRYISLKEAAKLQSFSRNFIPDTKIQQAYKQFGNSINVDVAKYIFNELVNIEMNTKEFDFH